MFTFPIRDSRKIPNLMTSGLHGVGIFLMATRQVVLEVGAYSVKAGLWEQTFIPTTV